jgi:hypothetical protein
MTLRAAAFKDLLGFRLLHRHFVLQSLAADLPEGDLTTGRVGQLSSPLAKNVVRLKRLATELQRKYKTKPLATSRLIKP